MTKENTSYTKSLSCMDLTTYAKTATHFNALRVSIYKALKSY